MKQKKKGSTLIELLLYMSLLTILTVMLVDIFVQALDVRLESEANSNVSSDGRFILSRFGYDIGRADIIMIPALLGDQTISLQSQSDGINYAYNLNGNNLELTDDISTERLNSFDTSVSRLIFKRLGNVTGKHTMQIQFTVMSNTTRKSGPEVKNFQTTIGLR